MLSFSVTTRIIEPRSELGVDQRNRVWLKDLINVTEALTQAGVRYWLDMGTLLGAVREGRFIGWDNDIDLSIETADSQKLLELTPTFANLGYRVDVTDSSIYLHGPGKATIGIAPYQREGAVIWNLFLVNYPKFDRVLKYFRRVADKIIYQPYQQKLPRFEQAVYTAIPASLRWWVRRLLFGLCAKFGERHIAMVLPSHFIDRLSDINFYGRSFPVPYLTEGYLAALYGDDWRTPKQNWRWEDTQAIDKDFFVGRDRSAYTLWGSDGNLEHQIIHRWEEVGPCWAETTIAPDNFEFVALRWAIEPPRQGSRRILDVGAGQGKLTAAFTQIGFEVVGLEPSSTLRERARQLHPDLEFVAGSATALPFTDASFDYVICVETLEHIPDTQLAITEMQRVLRPGGRLLIIDKNLNSLHYLYFIPTRLWKWWRELTGQWMYQRGFPFREKYFMPQDLNQCIRDRLGESQVHYLRFSPEAKPRPLLKRLLWAVHQMISMTLYRLWPDLSFYVAWEAVKHSSQPTPETRTADINLTVGVDWLLRGLRVGGATGFPAAYRWGSGWGAPYPETTGYIIPTLLNYIKYDGNRSAELQAAAQKAGDWLLSIQLAGGSFPGYGTTDPIVFDTGQIIFGLVALYRQTADHQYLLAARCAADWLIGQQEPDGSWIKYTYNGVPHAYHSRVAWALLVLDQIYPKDDYRSAAIKSLDWVVAQQQTNGWFNHVSFDRLERASLHTIAYTIQGLLESGLVLNNHMYIQRAKLAADQLLNLSRREELHSFYSPDWHPLSKSDCLVGLAQVALVWLRLFGYTQGLPYYDEAAKIINYLKSQQVLSHHNPNLRGALAGSNPFWGAYMPWTYPNWSVKFLIDLLIVFQRPTALPYQG
jgi:SAM-dependent methyltransferase